MIRFFISFFHLIQNISQNKFFHSLDKNRLKDGLLFHCCFRHSNLSNEYQFLLLLLLSVEDMAYLKVTQNFVIFSIFLRKSNKLSQKRYIKEISNQKHYPIVFSHRTRIDSFDENAFAISETTIFNHRVDQDLHKMTRNYVYFIAKKVIKTLSCWLISRSPQWTSILIRILV